MKFRTISVIGLGYIGLPTATMFASKKKQVVGVDLNPSIVDIINKGRAHINEPELDKLLNDVTSEGFLRAVTTPEQADAFIIAVPTPFLSNSENNEIPQPDLKFIDSSIRAIAPVLKKGDLIVIESTCPVGTTDKITNWLFEERSDLTFPHTHGCQSDIRIAYCPERVLPGQILRELVENDRIIGGMTKNCSQAATELYKVFVRGECILTDARTAEMAKLTENASRDVNIAFANELSIICDKLNINIWELIRISNRHPRVNILQPGPGVGGHCIAVDPWFIASATPMEAQLITLARKINNSKPNWVLEKVKLAISDYLLDHPNKSVTEIIIACYGLTFKANIDDLRESPALEIASKICNLQVGKVYLVEPNISKLPDSFLEYLLVDYDENDIQADIHVLLVDHDEFKGRKPKDSIVIDTRGIWSD